MLTVRNELGEGLLDLPPSGVGLAGLAGRLHDVGGELDAGPEAGWWVLRAVVPLADVE